MNIVKESISDARNFQRHGQYDLAIESLKKAQLAARAHKDEIEIQKLLGFNYRKQGKLDLALFHMNNAIKTAYSIFSQSHTNQMEYEYAVCLMNKGIIYEEKDCSNKALDCYFSALEIFLKLFDADTENCGIIINALITIGTLYYNQEQYEKATEFLKKALVYFENNPEKERDRRYLAIVNTLSKIDNV